MALSAGARLGPYEILGPLGSGGMGEVYRARDTRLDRLVAIKVAHERFGERFEREARTIAQLNHPHVCTLHDVGPDYLVMELIEGETLAARLRRGAVEPSQALTVAAQIAAGLAAAHAKGIVHRDLKPQNVMITRSGVKVLDFGIARAAHDETQSATVAGLGTPAYMAPEQREGRPADERSDHYALGLVLLEMITGRRPDAAEPRIPDDLPPPLGRAIARCLAQDPLDRWQSASDLAAVLGQIAPADAPRAAGARRPALWAVSAAALTLIVAAAIGALSWARPLPATKVIRLTIPPPEGTSFPTVSQAGAPAVSPDGHLIAFVADGADGRKLWVRSLDAFDARPLPSTAGAAHPAWSPDSGSLTFLAEGSLKRVGLDGQDAQVLSTNTTAAGAPTWNAGGQIVWSAANVLRVISAAGGEPSAATERDAALLEENHYAPSFLPDGRHYLVLVRGGAELKYQLCIGELGSLNGRRVLLSGVSAARYAPPEATGGDGSLLFVRDDRLLAQPFDPERLALTGEPRLVADRVASHSFGFIGDFAVSPAGVLAYRVTEPSTEELAWFDRSGRRVGGIGDRPGNRRNNVRLSPDGKSVAVVRQEGDVQDVWTYDLARGVATRLTFNGGRSPVWSPDGSEIMYLLQDTVFRKPVAGGAEVPVWKGSGLLALNDWSGDGRHLLFTRWDTSLGMMGRGLWLMSLSGGATSQEPTLFEAAGLHGQFGPAAGAPRWIAFDHLTGQSFVRTMPGGADGRWQISIAGGNAVRWRPDARELFFVSGPSFMAVEVEEGGGPGFRHSAPRPLFVAPPAIRVAMSQYALGYDVAADGQRFLVTFPTLETPSSVINVIINWQEALAR